MTSTLGGNVRWAAPELYHQPEDGSATVVDTHSDVYSYGSVTLEVSILVMSIEEWYIDVLFRFFQAMCLSLTFFVMRKSSWKFLRA